MQSADLALYEGRPAEALAALDALEVRPDRPASAVAATLRRAAEGLLAADARRPGAREAIFAAMDAGLPLPGLLLACGRFCRRRRLIERAAQCYMQLELLGHGEHLVEFYAAVPPEQRLQYLPVVRRLFERKRAPEHLLLLSALKQGLRRTLRLDEQAVLYARAFDLAPEPVRWLSMSGFAEHAAQADVASTEVFPAQPFRLAAPRTGEGPPALTETLSGRRMVITAIDDAEVSGQSSMVVSGGRVLFDYQGDELEQVVPVPTFDPLVMLHRSGRIARLTPSHDGGIGELPEAFHLLGWSTSMFGHWLCEYLPKVFALLGHDLLAGVPILVDEHMPDSHIAALRLFLGDRNPLIRVPLWAGVRVRRLWVCSTPMYVPIYPKPGQSLDYRYMSAPPEAFAALYRIGQSRYEALQPSTPGQRRIYFARRPSQHRKLVNHTEVEAHLRAHGFETVYAETLSFPEQLRTVREASHIVGPEGSALMLGWFARPGTRLAMLNHEFLENLPTVSGILEALGVATHIVSGRTVRKDEAAPRYSDYEIAPAQLDALLDLWQLAAPTRRDPP